jgi:hypothetical protein
MSELIKSERGFQSAVLAHEDVQLFEKRSGALVRRHSVTSAYFVPLYGTHGFTP